MKKRIFFTAKEDRKLEKLVKEMGYKWSEIAKVLSRDARSVRNRWENHLKPGIIKSPLTCSEVALLNELYKKYGPRWTVIANCLPGRTSLQIRNWFYGAKRKGNKKIKKKMSISKLLDDKVEVEEKKGESSHRIGLKESPRKKIEDEKAELKKIISNAKSKLGEDLEFLLEMYLETQEDIEKIGSDSFIEKHLQKLENSLTRKISKEELQEIYQKQKEVNQKENTSARSQQVKTEIKNETETQAMIEASFLES